VNGAKVTLVRVVFAEHEDGDLDPPVDPSTPWELDKLPLYLVVKLVNPGPSALHDPNLQKGEFLVEPSTCSFVYRAAGVEEDLGTSIRRLMFNVESAGATSEYKAQGPFSHHQDSTPDLLSLVHFHAIRTPPQICFSLVLLPPGTTLDRVVLDLRS
jgi:hypothetical protein